MTEIGNNTESTITGEFFFCDDPTIPEKGNSLSQQLLEKIFSAPRTITLQRHIILTTL